jgi:diguanylate cyclase (GGDEF)-like protein/PAS domain S-box-containing protein
VRAAAARPWVRSLCFVLLFALAVVLGRESRPEGSQIALVWPAAGVGVWWLMDLRGRRFVGNAALLLVVTVIPQLFTGLPLAASLLFGVANLGHAVVGALVLRRLWPAGPDLRASGDVIRLLVAAAAASAWSAPVSAALSWALLEADASTSLLLFAVRNTGSTFAVVATVVALRAPHHAAQLLSRTRGPEFATIVGLGFVIFAAVVWLDGDAPVGFLSIVLPVWAGTRLGVPRAGVVGGLMGLLSVLVTVAGRGVLGDVPSLPLLAVFIQVFMVLAMLVGLMLAAMQHSRDEVAERLRTSEARLRLTSDSALVATAVVSLSDPDRTLSDHNPAMRELFPGAGEHLQWRSLICDDSVPVVEQVLAGMLEDGPRSWNGEVRHRLPSGATLWTQVHVSALPSPTGPAAAVVQMLDITARKDADAHLAHLALHDPLTGLPNRLLLRDRLDHDLASAARNGTRVAVVFLDLDGFKEINDTLGHDVGDVVLCTTAERLQEALRPGDTVSRMGGDEFVACSTDVRTEEDAQALAQRLLDAVRPPVLVGDHLLAVGVSAGVTLSGPGEGSAALLRDADGAMYAAKRAGRGRVVVAWEDPPTPVPAPSNA